MSSYQEKPCSKSKFTVNPSQIGIADGTEDSEEESKGNLENVLPHLSSNSTGNNKKATKCLEPKRELSCNMYNELSKKKQNIDVLSSFSGQINFLGQLPV